MAEIAVSRRPLRRALDKLGDGTSALRVVATAVCFQAPYFGSIRPRFLTLRAGIVEVLVRKRRAVTNHLGTVHAIAICNAAELAAGTLLEVTLSDALRWIPVGMTVTYDKLAKTDLVVKAVLDPGLLAEPGEVEVPVHATDKAGDVVFTARIRMRISPQKRA